MTCRWREAWKKSCNLDLGARHSAQMGAKMKRLLQCRVTIFLLISWAALSVVGYMGKDSIYKNYKQDVWRMPYFVMVFEGAKDGVYPWDAKKGKFLPNTQQEPDAVRESEEGTEQSEGVLTATDSPTKGGLSNQQTETVIPTGKQPESISQPEAEQIPEEKEFIEVDESYFDDAVFIGDSRTVGLHEYGGLEQADFFATLGLNIYDMWTEKYCEVDGVKTTLEEALKAKQYKKIYFQIGINEMGRGTIDEFIQEYEETVERFKELQPDAIVYIQGIMRVAKKKSDSDVIFNNEGIRQRNERIEQLSDNQAVFYIDVNDVVCDGEGNLKE